MNKFDFDKFGNNDDTVMVFDYDKYKDKDVVQLSCDEGFANYFDSDAKFESFVSYIEYGFWVADDGEKYNGWYLRDLETPVKPKNNSRKVIVVREKYEHEQLPFS